MRLIGNRVLIKPDEPMTTLETGLILPGSIALEREIQEGVIVDISDVRDKYGASVSLGFGIGHRVVYGRSVGQERIIDGVAHRICDIDDVWAVKCDGPKVEEMCRCPECNSIIRVLGDTTLSYFPVNEKEHFQKKNPDIEVPFYCTMCGAIKFPFRAVRDVVIIYAMQEPEKVGSIYLPEEDGWVGGSMRQRIRQPYAVVLSVGPGYYDKKKRIFRRIHPEIERGDVVIFEKRIPKGWVIQVQGTDNKAYKAMVCGYEDLYAYLK